MFWEGTTSRMQKISKIDSCALAVWLPVAYEQGVTLWEAGWPKFSGKVEDFPEFKIKWHKICKTGIGDMMLLRVH
jgi:predicted NUDIX family NTP pyrophosphohydrolase